MRRGDAGAPRPRPSPKRWAVPTPGSRLSCAPSVMLNARGASPRLARRPGSRRASLACGGHASQRARRDAVHARFPSIRHGTAVTPSPPGKGGQCPHPARDGVDSLRSCYARVGLTCNLRGGPARGGHGAGSSTLFIGRAAMRNLRGSPYPSRHSRDTFPSGEGGFAPFRSCARAGLPCGRPASREGCALRHG